MSEYSGELPPNLCEKGVRDPAQIEAIIGVLASGVDNEVGRVTIQQDITNEKETM